MTFGADDPTRRKKAILLFALVLLVAAIVLTIISLDPADREPETAGPQLPSPTSAPSTTPSTSPSAGPSSAPSAGDERRGSAEGTSGGARCVVGGAVQMDCPESFRISGSAAGLFPGGTVMLPLTVTNPNEHAIRVTSIEVSVTKTSTASCDASFLSTSDYTGSGFVVPADGSSTVSLPITMSRSAPDACQNVTFTLSYAGKAEQA